MEEFNVVPFLLGLLVGAALGTASGWVATRKRPGQQIALGALADGTRLSSLLFWLGFILATGAGLSAISSGSFWRGNFQNLMIGVISAVVVSLASRAVRIGHNRSLVGSDAGQGS